ncbi:hypothetical protein PIB30_095493 [Stylosanthes scabra]|uniref:Uncharacterized protein n=1 Tax=Stylosanthes scabra TaxID=79078 RepID=A0ABU6SXB2_9FABA|nr:hypothetical protein [Stylosanthes scabra]
MQLCPPPVPPPSCHRRSSTAGGLVVVTAGVLAVPASPPPPLSCCNCQRLYTTNIPPMTVSSYTKRPSKNLLAINVAPHHKIVVLDQLHDDDDHCHLLELNIKARSTAVGGSGSSTGPPLPPRPPPPPPPAQPDQGPADDDDDYEDA